MSIENILQGRTRAEVEESLASQKADLSETLQALDILHEGRPTMEADLEARLAKDPDADEEELEALDKGIRKKTLRVKGLKTSITNLETLLRTVDQFELSARQKAAADQIQNLAPKVEEELGKALGLCEEFLAQCDQFNAAARDLRRVTCDRTPTFELSGLNILANRIRFLLASIHPTLAKGRTTIDAPLDRHVCSSLPAQFVREA